MTGKGPGKRKVREGKGERGERDGTRKGDSKRKKEEKGKGNEGEKETSFR